MASLVNCQRCARHVRSHETVCPFCGVTLRIQARRRSGPWVAAAVAAGISTLGYACACYGATPLPDSAPLTTDAAPATDAVAADAGTDAVATTDGGPASDSGDGG